MQNTFKTWMLATYEHNELADIANHGCESGCAGGMIYYSETTELFLQFRDELFDIMSEAAADTGADSVLPVYVQKNSDTFTSFANAVVWYCAELVAYEATQGEYIGE